VPVTERKLMSKHCCKVLPKAELLKKELTLIYKKEHEVYLREVELIQKRMEIKEEYAKRANKEGFRSIENTSNSAITSSHNASGGAILPGNSYSITGIAPSAPPLFGDGGYRINDDYYGEVRCRTIKVKQTKYDYIS